MSSRGTPNASSVPSFNRGLPFDTCFGFPTLYPLQACRHLVFCTARAANRRQPPSSHSPEPLQTRFGKAISILFLCCYALQPLNIVIVGFPHQKSTAKFIFPDQQLREVDEFFEVLDDFRLSRRCRVPRHVCSVYALSSVRVNSVSVGALVSSLLYDFSHAVDHAKMSQPSRREELGEG